MSSVITTTGNTVVSVLNTINVVATQTARTINTVAAGLDMLDTFVGAARTKQIARTELEMDSFLLELHEDSALQTAQRQKTLSSTLRNDPELSKLFTENHQRLNAVMERIQSKIAPQS
jgi:hypothetical protein